MDEKLNFLLKLEEFKTIKRHCHTSINIPETNSDHTWHLCMFIMLYEDEIKKELDFEKVIKISLIHDLPEIITGDELTIKKASKDKSMREKEGARLLFNEISNPEKNLFINLIEEYCEISSKEAEFVKGVDKLMPLIQNIKTANTYSSYKKNKVTSNECYEYIKKFIENNKLLNNLFENLFKKAIELNIFYEE